MLISNSIITPTLPYQYHNGATFIVLYQTLLPETNGTVVVTAI